MGNLVKLSKYKQQKRKEWLQKNESHLRQFLLTHMLKTVRFTFAELSQCYQDRRYHKQEESWDYEDLRDLIHDHITKVLLDPLYKELRGCKWFAAQLFSKEDILECCINLYVVESISA
jgi:hypothetical protein